MSLTTHRVLITGGVSGIGLAIASAFAQNGAHLVLGGLISADEGREISLSMQRLGASSCEIDRTDISDAAAGRRMVEQMIASRGGIDILVNNAGIQHVAPVEDFPAEKWQQVIDINLSAPFHLSAAALPAMRKSGFGRIINIASVHGQVASVHKAAYVAAKHGLIGLTKTIALECADTDITCNAICPGWVRTALVEKQIVTRASQSGQTVDAEAHALVSEKQPTGKFMEPEQIAEMVLFLTGPASHNITGSAFTLDGGWTSQ